jgi:lysophospholipase L1-like esterase
MKTKPVDAMSRLEMLGTLFKTRILKTALVLLSFAGMNCVAVEDFSPGQFRNGDTVAFIGDSITHNGVYNQQILLYYATRFPERRFAYWGLGIAGDTAAGACTRYPWDIAPHKPTVAAIMLGMNDIGRFDPEARYGKSEASAGEGRRKELLDLHFQNMRKLCESLAKDGCRMILLTSMYDQTSGELFKNFKDSYGANDALASCADYYRKLAVEFNGSVVDINTPMTKLNNEWQRKDRSFAIVGPDRVHLNQVGGLVAAYLFLKAQNVPSLVSSMNIDAAKGSVVSQENCQISNVVKGADGISFECKESALPFPVRAAAQQALFVVPFTNDLNREMLTVSSLPPGGYTLLIDGKPVEEFFDTELFAGVNLAENDKTPQYAQALKVANLNDQRNAAEDKLRQIAAVRLFFFEKEGIKPGDAEGEKRVLDDCVKNKRLPWAVNGYIKYKPEEGKVAEELANLYSGMYRESQPITHKYEIRRNKS